MPAVSRIIRPSRNFARSATVTSTGVSSSSQFPLANIKDNDVALPYKAGGVGAVRIIFDCGAPVLVDEMCLPMYNIPAATSNVKWQGHTSNSWGAPDVSVTLVIPTYATLRTGMTPIPESIRADVAAVYPLTANRTKQWWSLDVPSIGVALAIG